MRRELLITEAAIDESSMPVSRRAGRETGAAVCFSGLVRGTEGGSAIAGLDYEVFRPMAERQFHLIFDEVGARWPVESIRLIHRVGKVAAGETSLWVEVVASHRGEAFAACQHLIDEMKRRVPIWKKPF